VSEFEAVHLRCAGPPDELQFPTITRYGRFVRAQCGARAVNIMPDWRKLNASGMGRRS
jgi:hypothetical protein